MPNISTYCCPNCFSKYIIIFHELRNFPVHSVLNMYTREEALLYPRGDIILGFCSNCGFVFNVAFDPAMLKYSSDCEESQGFSPTFNAFAQRLAENLIEQFDIRNKDIIEIGCGKGEFLTLLCELGDNRGVGFDPAYVKGRTTSETTDKITFIRDFYSEKYSKYLADFICCKMTLEHIFNTAEFINTIRQSIGDRLDTIVFVQVPDATRIFKECAFEDIYYEHCSYFTPNSLSLLFKNAGFEVLCLSTEYNDQYLYIVVKPTSDKKLHSEFTEDNNLGQLKNYIIKFQKMYQTKIKSWQIKLQNIIDKKEKTVIWGAGSKGVAFLNTFRNFKLFEYVVDINLFRQGTYMAGTGQKIVAPEFLQQYNPDVVIIMNSIYSDEIKQSLSSMNLAPEFLTI